MVNQFSIALTIKPIKPIRLVRLKLFFGILLLFLPFGIVHAQNESNYYQISTFDIPKDIALECGGIAFDEEGYLYLATRRGEVWRLSNIKSKKPSYQLFAQGLHETLGLAYKDGALYTAQRGELTKLLDNDKDGVADEYERVAHWPITGNYHEYSYGPKFFSNGDMLLTFNVAWRNGGESLAKWRGWMVKVTPEGRIEPLVAGLRSPAGFYINKKDEIFFAENQGDWIASGRVTHVEKGDFAGHKASLRWSGEPDSPVDINLSQIQDKASGGNGDSMFEYAEKVNQIKPPSVWFPHGIMGNSTSGITEVPKNFGPFEGQLLVGDQAHSKIMRMSLEKVRGVYQGACYDFVSGFDSGILRFDWHKDELYVAQTARGWWATGGKPFAIQKLNYKNKIPFEIEKVSIKPDGFEINFTKPVQSSWGKKAEDFSITDFTYLYHQTYGSPIVERESRLIHHIEWTKNRKKVRVYLDRFREGFIYEIKLKNCYDGQTIPLLHQTAYYTVNRIPFGDIRPYTPKKSESNIRKKMDVKQSLKRVTELPTSWKEDEVLTLKINPAKGMRYEQKLLQVNAGQKVKLVFNNTDDDMTHNLVIVDLKAADEVVEQALNLGLEGPEKSYVPDSDKVLFHTNLLQPKAVDEIYFEVPTTPGDYVYVCTYPGHGQFMRGILRVK